MLNPIIPSYPFLIAGPCALESEEMAIQIAQTLKRISAELKITVIFKGSYTKANRTREDAFNGLGLEQGLEILASVHRETGLLVTSDVHEANEIEKAAEVLDVIQIPALLCKNTGVLHTAADTGKTINIKKGHFLTAQDLRYSVEKIEARGNRNIILTERGNLFGYGETIIDFRNFSIMRDYGYPVVFDVSHSVRNTARRAADPCGGTPQHIPLLTRCAAAAGAAGLFVETHPAPDRALCDAAVSYPLADLAALVKEFKQMYEFTRNLTL
ncbi:MAG: 3-deoxy-8-phosphooctulonate synthase [bacterium]|nr:3-deoxy-8-phosphooctulonate synthase [bacterium]